MERMISGDERQSDLYGITVYSERYNSKWSQQEFGTVTRAEWDARPHRVVTVGSAHDPEVDPRPLAEVYQAYVWCVGILARVAFEWVMDGGVFDVLEHGHPGCIRRDHVRSGDFGCGDVSGILNPRYGANNSQPPEVDFTVPREQTDRCRHLLERFVATMLANDRAPLTQPTRHPAAHLRPGVSLSTPSIAPTTQDQKSAR